ncbi:MAG: Holliday junction branch migration protein RuvA [Proteobacteria bacterium]|nr:Holliday junction branch migration protein RuvA [Pseudomonadales bacterium]MDA0805279.1 Holliday junction branch migration protein RuvA [Pseudomonadota bacterium]MDA0895370.1 Holliday junction branch migration protein RuvA [Pseudomonadota bacterium]MDA1244190.1 Holliday junction branch migration protein RuvA [Pseudomonadota bacterium]
MIGRIRGILIEKEPADIQVEVGGIAYEVQVPMSTLFKLPEIGEVVTLHTHFVVREDAQQLFGFIGVKDKALFRTLIKVNGVGPKMALGILSSIDSDALVGLVLNNDIAALVAMPGIGKKTAERLVIELRDKIKDWEVAGGSHANAGAKASSPNAASAAREAETALVSLGYKLPQAARAIASVQKDRPELASSEELIRFALKSMA